LLTDGSRVTSLADRPSLALETVTSQGVFLARAANSLSAVCAAGAFHPTTIKEIPRQTTPNAASQLRTTFVPVKLSFTWLVRKTLAPEQRTQAAQAFRADRELLTTRRHQLDRR